MYGDRVVNERLNGAIREMRLQGSPVFRCDDEEMVNMVFCRLRGF